jgi:hypothetical protein
MALFTPQFLRPADSARLVVRIFRQRLLRAAVAEGQGTLLLACFGVELATMESSQLGNLD